MPPTDQDLDQLVEELAPLVQRLFLDSGIPELEAEQMVRDALVRLCYRWDRIKDREGWLLRTLAKEVRARSTRPATEPIEEPDDA